MPLAGMPPRAAKCSRVASRGRGPLPRDDLDVARLRVVDEDRHLAAEAERGGVGDAEGEDHGDGRVGRVAPRFQDLEPRLDGGLPAGHHGTFMARALPARATFNGAGRRPGRGPARLLLPCRSRWRSRSRSLRLTSPVRYVIVGPAEAQSGEGSVERNIKQFLIVGRVRSEFKRAMPHRGGKLRPRRASARPYLPDGPGVKINPPFRRDARREAPMRSGIARSRALRPRRRLTSRAHAIHLLKRAHAMKTPRMFRMPLSIVMGAVLLAPSLLAADQDSDVARESTIRESVVKISAKLRYPTSSAPGPSRARGRPAARGWSSPASGS